jgi:hypothetical protein
LFSLSIDRLATLGGILAGLGVVILGDCVGKYEDLEVDAESRIGFKFEPAVEPASDSLSKRRRASLWGSGGLALPDPGTQPAGRP